MDTCNFGQCEDRRHAQEPGPPFRRTTFTEFGASNYKKKVSEVCLSDEERDRTIFEEGNTMSKTTKYTCGCSTTIGPPPKDCPSGEHSEGTLILEEATYVERRVEDRPGCSECGAEVHVGPGMEMLGYCSADSEHHWDDRRKSTKCGCGKWRCPAPGNQSPGAQWTCFLHPQYGFDMSEAYLPGDKNYGVDLQIPKHHTDGTQACKTNHRTPEGQEDWEVGHALWKDAQAKLPDLAAVMDMLYNQANPLSFDGHDNFKFVRENPEEAAICIHHMYDTLHSIQIGQEALARLLRPKP